jgi:hypothetical protein
MPDHHIAAAQLGEHRAGDLPGVRPAGVRREVLRAVRDVELVAVDRGLHAAQVRERRQHGHLDVGELLLGEAERQLLHQRDGFEVVQVHLPVAGDDGPASVVSHASEPP